jgi:sugar phosphate isomerase/epimerase
MRLGCAAYSYRDLLKSGEMTLETFVDLCAELDLDGAELTAYYFPDTGREYLHRLRRHCFRRGVDVLGAAIGSNFTLRDAGARRAQVRNALEWLEHTYALGAPCLRVFAGPVPEGVLEETACEWAIECLQEVVERAGQVGVVVALENHGGVTDTAPQVLRFTERLAGPWFGLNLDFGNFHVDPYAEIRAVAAHAVTTHAKLVSRFGSERRELDYARIRAIMEEAGFRGYVSIEYEEAEDPRAAIPPFVANLRRALSR